jgi:hypothetical protein
MEAVVKAAMLVARQRVEFAHPTCQRCIVGPALYHVLGRMYSGAVHMTWTLERRAVGMCRELLVHFTFIVIVTSSCTVSQMLRDCIQRYIPTVSGISPPILL